MKTKLLALVACAALTAPLFGQITQPILATISFPFVVQGKQLPPGKYELDPDRSNPAVMEIRTQDGTKSMVVIAESAQTNRTPNQANLVFDKIDGRYFLSQIWTVGSDLGMQIPEKTAERRWENDYAASHSNSKQLSQQVTVPCTR